jgi:hypothetical protein
MSGASDSGLEPIMIKAALQFSVCSAICLMAVVKLRAADEKKVNQAIERAVEYLKVDQAIERAVEYLKVNYKFDLDAKAAPQSRIGETDRGIALCGIALLEAKVKKDDPTLVDIARVVRLASIDEERTYCLAWNLIFLDKLGDDIDLPLIQSMGARLIVGQNEAGGWANYVPTLNVVGIQRMVDMLNAVRLTGKLSANIRTDSANFMQQILQGGHTIPFPDTSGNDDNANTVLAATAIWSARKYGVPANALNNVQRRFRGTQYANGGWSNEYQNGNPQGLPSPSMTCAGLVALALANGFQREHPVKSRASINADGKFTVEPGKDKPRVPSFFSDRQIQAGMAYLGASVNENRLGELSLDLFFLWNLERFCLAAGIETLGGKKWFDLGLASLLGRQNPDGSFSSEWGKRTSTSIALMFLLRANLLRDLTRILKSGGDIKPSEKTSAPEPSPAKDKPAEPPLAANPMPCEMQCLPCPCPCCCPRPCRGLIFRRR